MVKKIKSSVDINRENKEFWQKTTEQFNELCEKHPEDLAQKTTLATKIGKHHINDIGFATETSVVFAMLKSDEIRQTELKTKQQENAKKPRTRDPLTGIIRDIVKRNPGITQSELLEELQRNDYFNVIKFDSDGIIFTDPKFLPVDFSALKHRLSKAKKKLKKAE